MAHRQSILAISIILTCSEKVFSFQRIDFASKHDPAVSLNDPGLQGLTKINPDALAQIESVWEKVLLDYTFDFAFLDQEMNSSYDPETKFLSPLNAISVVVI